MKRIAVFPGHHIHAPGAQGGGFIEHPICRLVAERVKLEYRTRGYISFDYELVDPYPDFDRTAARNGLARKDGRDVAEWSLNRRIAWINSQPLDAVVELHLNAWSDPAVNHAYPMYQEDRPRSLALAQVIAEWMQITGFADTLPKPKTQQDVGATKGMLKYTDRDVVIAEPAFITHPAVQRQLATELDTFVDLYAECILMGVTRWAATIPDPEANDAGE